MLIIDESLSGERIGQRVIEMLTERMTVREIIRARIWQEVHEYNAGQRQNRSHWLISPTGQPSALGKLLRTKAVQVDWKNQYQMALDAFEKNGFFLLVGDQQATDLDEEFVVEPETVVSFVKLVPLVGG